ncbi:MAG: hypothetical protein L6R42_002324 [Xanthoria sp. 1 TBL-2021]|nr:MAG: hypothetical protein L6R42_002324 [Xanthoria sp. 1 TBL-2021]
MAMMPSGTSGNPYDNLNNTQIEQDLIDPDDGNSTLEYISSFITADSQIQANINDLDDPIEPNSDRAPLTGNIQNPRNPLPQSYLNSTIPGEDRRAPQNTIDESVWDTLSRDVLAVWEKMRQVLWPKYLLGGFLQRGGGLGGAERGEGDSLAGGFRSIAGRWPDADVVLQGGMSEGLRDWDLWGPLIFCLLLSLLLSMTASSEQKTVVFSGVFALVWIGEAVVTAQIKLLGGNISFFQSVCIIGYTLFPLVVAAMLSAVHLPMIARIPVYIVLVGWSLAAGISILGGSGVVKNRVGIATTPNPRTLRSKKTQNNPDLSGVQRLSRESGQTQLKFIVFDLILSGSLTLPHPIQNMAQDTEQPEDRQEPAADHHIVTNPPHTQNPENLRVATSDLMSDKDTSDPVREKLKKTSLASIPRTDSTAVDLGSTIENGSPQEPKRPPEEESLNQTPSPTSESRGRLSRKRSYDDSVEPVGAANGSSSENHQIEDDSKHARKRSRDVRAVHPQNTKSAATPTEGSLLEREASSDEALDNENSDRAMEDPVHSPRKKRSREDIDTDLHRGQKIAATDEAKAYRRSEDSERSQLHPQDDGGAVTAENGDQQEQQAGTSTTDIHSIEPAAQRTSPQPDPPGAAVDQKDTSKVPTSFAASGFAAMSGSSTSPFGAFGAPTASVFGSKPVSNFGAAGTGNTGVNGVSTSQNNAPSAFGASPSPFLSSSSMTTGSGFGITGAGSKSTGFGGSVFGSGFGNPTAGAPRLSSFAAPTSDVAIPKSTENKTAFGVQADDSGEEDGGSEGDANPEDTEAGDDETDSRFEQQEVETGEAGEESIFMSPRAQLYNFDSGGWKEKGRGVFKLNVSESEGARKARFIMRANQTFRVLVNQPVFKKMQVGDRQGREPSGKQFSFAVIDQGRPTPHLLKLGDEAEAKKLYREVMKLQQDLETQA